MATPQEKRDPAFLVPQTVAHSTGLAQSILVVDDDPGMREMLVLRLRRDGYLAAEADSVADAVRRLKARRYLIITDLRMEPLDGLDLLTLVRRYHPGCPPIVITAFDSPGVRAQALRLGAVDVLAKPFAISDLLRRVRKILAERGSPSSRPVGGG